MSGAAPVIPANSTSWAIVASVLPSFLLTFIVPGEVFVVVSFVMEESIVIQSISRWCARLYVVVFEISISIFSDLDAFAIYHK